MGRLVWCRLCTHRHENIGGDLPETCPQCGASAHWSSLEIPAKEYVLTEMDKRFLKQIRVEAES